MSPRVRFIIIGAIAGAVLGATGAWAYFENQEGGLWVKKRKEGKNVTVRAGAGDYFKIGLTMLGLVRQVQGMIRPG